MLECPICGRAVWPSEPVVVFDGAELRETTIPDPALELPQASHVVMHPRCVHDLLAAE
jgi:hypothetical protein